MSRWYRTQGLLPTEHPHLVALVRAGATFVNGKLVEGPDNTVSTTQPEAA